MFTPSNSIRLAQMMRLVQTAWVEGFLSRIWIGYNTVTNIFTMEFYKGIIGKLP